jgi:predicted NBD/HSP70 family sugar kinase
MRVALGLRAHSGWTALVAVAGPADAPRILDRRRIIIADPRVPHSKQPYHAAAELVFAKAEALVRSAIDSSQNLAAEALALAERMLRAQGHVVAGCAIVLGSGRPLPELRSILASHALIHTAEGEMFRDALLKGAVQCGIPATGIREKDLDPALLARAASLGKVIGPPWTVDQKQATAAALMSLRES